MSSKREPQDLKIHMDAATQTVTLEQKQSRLSLTADKVVVPVAAIEAIYVQIMLASLKARGVVVGQVAEPTTGVGLTA